MIDNGLAMHPRPTEIVNVYDQNFNGLGATVELFSRHYSDEKITRSKGKEVFTFQAMSSSAIYQHLKAENIIEFGGRWFRIKYVEDDDGVKGLTKFTCYALWYELAEGLPSPLSVATSTLSQVAGQIVEPFGKWVKLVIPDSVVGKSVRGVTLKENSALYKLRYLAKQYSMELTFGYEEVIENELRYVKTVVFLQPYAERKIEFPLVVEHNLKHVTRTEDSRNLVTAYKLTGKAENEGEEFTFASLNGGNPFLVDTSWFTTRQMKPRIIPKTKQDDRFTVKQNMLDAARAYLDMYSKPLVGYEANAVLYDQIPDLHHTQLIIDDDYQITEWRKVTSRSLDYDDLTNSTIVFEDPRQDLMDLLNDDGDGALSYESHEQARTVVRFAHGPNGENMNAEAGPYIGVISTTKPTSAITAQDFSWVKVKGEDGKPGADGRPGRDGVDGVAGKNGVGIIDTTISYFLSTSGSATPSSGWTEQVPTLVKGRYLWTKTTWRYSDGSQETGYNVSYIAQDGNKGNDGIAGKDGVGIARTVITYAPSTSGTTSPSSGWQAQVPTVAAGQFLWTRTVWHYTDSTSETGYSVSKIGEKGADGARGATGPKGDPGRDGVAGAPGVGIRSTTITYGLSASETVQPTSWSSSVPALVKGQFLWTKTVWTYTNNTSETGYSKNYIARDGNNGADGIAGKDGVGIRATVITYASSTSGTSAPVTGWQTQVPAVANGHFLWTRTVWTYTDGTNETGYNVSRMGDDGRGILTSFSFYRLTATADTPATAPKEGYLNLSSTGPANVWEPFRVMTANAEGWGTIDVDRIYKKDIIPGKPFRWTSEISLDGVSPFGSATDFSITMENWYRNSSRSAVYNPAGTKRYTANKFSATNDTSVNNYLAIDGEFTVSQSVYDAIPDESYLNLRIRLDRFTKASYHAKNSFVTYSSLPSGDKRGSGNYSTMSWHPLPPTPTDSTPFLWHYQVHLHTDGTLKYYDPTIISVKGQNGQDGINGKDSSINITCGFTPGFYEKFTPVNQGVGSISYVGDGWARLSYTNSSTSTHRVEFWLPKPEGITEGQYYTFLHEFRNDQSDFNGDFYHVQENRSAFWGNGSGQETGSANKSQVLVRRFRKPYVQGNTLANTKELVRININVPASKNLSVEMRVSCYVGKYEGPYIPYIGTSEAAWASKADAALTESQLNAIIQKQLTMQAELEAAATMANLSELQKATMEYIEKNDREKKASEEAIIEAGRRITDQEEKLGGMAKLRTFLTTYIREAEEGMIFGSTNSDAQLKITNDRISMHTGNREVMSISQGVITINNGVFTITLQVGRFKTESYAENPDINVCRYVG